MTATDVQTLASTEGREDELRQLADDLRIQINQALRGKSDVIEQVLICLLSAGHLLLEDRPGLGKTSLAKAIATAIGGRFSRVQCTPDLLPSDITGFNLFNQKTREFDFRQGPVFADILLADEINRATPRTQSALLEAMAERQVTVDAVRYPLADDFFVIATQNPIDQHGTYPLPEAQLDRFAMKLSIGYPAHDDEMQLLADAVSERSGRAVAQVMQPGNLLALQQEVAGIAVADSIRDYLVRMAKSTRNHPLVTVGLSPRGLLVWQRAAQAAAFLADRDFVTPDDVQLVLKPCLSVRLGIDQDDPTAVLDEIIEQTPLPEYRLST